MDQAANQNNDGQQDQQQDQQQQNQDQQQKDGAPDTYEFKAPEGQEFDPDFLKTYSEVAKELDLTQEKAQTLIDKVGPAIQARQQAKLDAVRQEWADTSKADKEFGGEKLTENLGVAKQALDKFGTPELKELLDASGIGNHPEVIRFFFRTGKALQPDGFVGGNNDGQAAPLTSHAALADRLYGSSK